MVARSPGLPRHPIFRSQPALGHRLEQSDQLLIGAPELESAGQPPVAVELNFRLTRRVLLRAPPAFFAVLVFPLLLAPVSISQFFLISVRLLSRKTSSSSPLSVWVWACDAALISTTRRARAFRQALAMQRASLRRRIFLCLLCVRCLDSAIFLEYQKRLLRFPILHLPVSLLESQ